MPMFSSPEWTTTYPEGWVSERGDEDSVIFYNKRSEVGTVQVSCICKETEVTDEDLLEMADEIISSGKKFNRVTIGRFPGLMFRYYAGEESWREWYLAAGNCLFFITYDCPREFEGLEDEQVAQILRAITVRETRH